MNKEQAIRFANSRRWERLSHSQIARLQLGQNLLCVPFSRFHEAVEKTLGRPVFTHEFAERGQLQGELNGKLQKRTVSESINALSKYGKPVLVVEV